MIENSEGTDNEPITLSSGNWSENVSWEFMVNVAMPEDELCTAVCCVTLHNGKLVLVQNNRGWELPAGKREEDETVLQAVQREVLEETRGCILEPKFFGYKKLTAKEPVPKPNNAESFYPFPNSYVIYYVANVTEFLDQRLEQDIKESKLVDLEEAAILLQESGQYTNILEYLLENKLFNQE